MHLSLLGLRPQGTSRRGRAESSTGKTGADPVSGAGESQAGVAAAVLVGGVAEVAAAKAGGAAGDGTPEARRSGWGRQGGEQVGLGLGGLPEGVELGVLELDQPLAGLEQLGEGGLVLVEEALEAADLGLERLGQAGGPVDQAVGGVPLGGGRLDLGDRPLLGRLQRPAARAASASRWMTSGLPLLSIGSGVT